MAVDPEKWHWRMVIISLLRNEAPELELISSVIAKGLNTYVNVISIRFFTLQEIRKNVREKIHLNDLA